MWKLNAFFVLCLLPLLLLGFPFEAPASIWPNSSITDPVDGALISGETYVVTGTASPNGNKVLTKVEVSINDGPWQLATGTESWSFVCTWPADGVYNIKSKATDNTGTEEVPGSGVTVTVDKTLPSTTVTSPADGSVFNTGTITLSGTAEDGAGSGVEKVEISTDGGNSWDSATGVTSWSYDWTVPPPENYSMWRVASACIRDGQGSETRTVRVRHLLSTGGSQVRVGFVSGPSQPITVTEAYIGNDAGGGAVSGNVQLTFGGVSSVAVPAGQIMYSDPVPWNAIRGDTVVITSYGTGTSWGKGYPYPSFYEDGNVAGVTRPLANVSDWDHGYNVWNALIVETLCEGVTSSENVLILGDSIALGGKSKSKECRSWPSMLDARVNVFNAARSGTTAAYEAGVITDILNRGISFDKAIISLGTNDLADGYTESEIEANLGTIISTLKSAGIIVYAGNIMARSADSVTEAVRLGVNNWLSTLPDGLDGVIDFDLATTDPQNQDSLLYAYDSGDGLHPNDLGHAAMFDAINRENLFTGGEVFDIYVRSTDVAGNVEYPYQSVRLAVDNDSPASEVIIPVYDETLYGASFSVWGTAYDGQGSGVSGVEISTDGGTSWSSAEGTSVWHYEWLLPVFGSFTIMSRATDMAGNTETGSPGVLANITPYGSPELQHYNWDASISGGGCDFCHAAANEFLTQTFKSEPGYCSSCHNRTGVAHEMSLYSQRGHSIMVNVTSGGMSHLPTYGNITAGEYNNQPFSRLEDGKDVICITCHNDMRKTEDYGRVWEQTTTDDQLSYTLQWGGWDGYGYLVPRVYSDTSLWSGPGYSRDKKAYLVDPSEYTYDEAAGTITFASQRQASEYIYVSLDYPYLRASSQDNRLCSDCHAQATHMGANCLTCHQAHNSANIADVRDKLRTTDLSERNVVFRSYTGYGSFADGDAVYNGVCEVCHTQTSYYTRDGSGFANHSGGANYDGDDCTACHPHSSGFSKYPTVPPSQQQGSGEALMPLPLQGYSM